MTKLQLFDFDSQSRGTEFMVFLPFGQTVSVSHLFFADDSLMFLRATPKGALVMKSVLSLYEQVSGQKVSLEKSAAYFSQHVQWGNSDKACENAWCSSLRW